MIKAWRKGGFPIRGCLAGYDSPSATHFNVDSVE